MSAQRRVVINAIAHELALFDLGRPVRVAVDGITGVGTTKFADDACDVIFAAGLVSHLGNLLLGLVELARVARAGTALATCSPS